MDLNSLYTDLTEQQRSAVISLPRAERLVKIASIKNVEVSELVALLAKLSGLPVAKNIELVEKSKKFDIVFRNPKGMVAVVNS